MLARVEGSPLTSSMSESDYIKLFDNLNNVKRLFLSNPDIIHQRTPEGQTLLHIVATAGNNDLVRFLLERGADINAQDQDGMTPLHRAVHSNKEMTVILLINQNAGLLANNKGETVLHIAIKEKANWDIRDSIGKKYPESVNMQDCDGNTALHVALNGGFDDGVDYLLLNMQADDSIPNNAGITPLQLVDETSNIDRKASNKIRCQLGIVARGELIKLKLLVENDKNILDIRHRTLGLNLLHIAAFNGRLDIIRYLTVEKRFLLSEKCDRDRTPLLCALQNGKIDAANFLCNEREFPLPDKDASGRTPLLMSVCSGDLDTVKYVVEYKHADLTEKSNGGNTALFYSVYYNHFHIFKYLIERNIFSLDKTNDKGHTVLTLAAELGNFDVVKYFVEGNYVTLRDVTFPGKNILILAMPHYDVFKYILDHIDLLDNYWNLAIVANSCSKELRSIIDEVFEERLESTLQSIQSSTNDDKKAELVVSNELADLYLKVRPQSAKQYLLNYYIRGGSPEKAYSMYQEMLDATTITSEERESINLSIAELFLTMQVAPAEIDVASNDKNDKLFNAAIGALPHILQCNSVIAQKMKNVAICFLCGIDSVCDYSEPLLIPHHIIVLMMKHINPADHPEASQGLWKLIQDNSEQYAKLAAIQTPKLQLTTAPTLFSAIANTNTRAASTGDTASMNLRI